MLPAHMSHALGQWVQRVLEPLLLLLHHLHEAVAAAVAPQGRFCHLQVWLPVVGPSPPLPPAVLLLLLLLVLVLLASQCTVPQRQEALLLLVLVLPERQQHLASGRCLAECCSARMSTSLTPSMFG